MKASLRSLQSAAKSSAPDLVELWKERARASVSNQWRVLGAKPSLRFHVSFGFVVLAGVLGARMGQYGSLRTLILLSSILLVHKSARAFSSGLTCCNRDAEVEQLLREARDKGCRSLETSKLLIELLFARGDNAGALALAEADADLLSAQDRDALAAAFSHELPAQTAIFTAS